MGRRLYVGLKLLPQLKAADDARLQVLIWGDLGQLIMLDLNLGFKSKAGLCLALGFLKSPSCSYHTP